MLATQVPSSFVRPVLLCNVFAHGVMTPSSYLCGHGHCYTCARVWLEQQWTCPHCEAVITRAPFRVDAVESLMARVYGDWDESRVSYEWSGLIFPVLPLNIV